MGRWECFLQNFLKGKTKEAVAAYEDNLGKLDWIMVARPPRKDQLTMVPMEALRSADGKPGLDVVYYEDMEFQKEVYHEVAKVVNLSAIEELHQVLLCICLMVMVLNGVVKYFLLSVVNIRLFLRVMIVV